MIDIHCHILPGIDDGPTEWAESLKMCDMAVRDGIRTIVATPHMNNGHYSNSKETIIKKIEELRERINGRFELDIFLGADVHVSFDLVERLKSKEIPTINNKGYVLLELPHELLPPNIESLIFNIKVMGITPIITHVERTLWIKKHFQSLKKLVDMGALLQITAMSITGEFGRSAKHWSEKLLKEKLVHIIASDGHSINRRPPIMSKALNVASSIVGRDEAYAMVNDTPLKVIKGEESKAN